MEHRQQCFYKPCIKLASITNYLFFLFVFTLFFSVICIHAVDTLTTALLHEMVLRRSWSECSRQSRVSECCGPAFEALTTRMVTKPKNFHPNKGCC
uniref:Uncharacterized protein n=1 Tax=Ixodes ricinus TaxID=34613 RepID=A0A147BKG4_IXORI